MEKIVDRHCSDSGHPQIPSDGGYTNLAPTDRLAHQSFPLIIQMLGYSKSFAPPMIKSFSLALALAHFLIASPDAVAAQVFKCNVNGAVHYQQGPCQSHQDRNPPTVEELNAERKKQLTQEKEHPTSPKSQARSSASPEPLEEVPAKVPSSPRSSFKCDSRKYCSQMASCAEAKYFLSNCPGVKMDGDGDGIPCEEQLCGH